MKAKTQCPICKNEFDFNPSAHRVFCSVKCFRKDSRKKRRLNGYDFASLNFKKKK